MSGRMGQRLIAVVAAGPKGRTYLPAHLETGHPSLDELPDVGPEQELDNDPRNLWCIPYGLRRFCDLFTKRQLVALTTFCSLLGDARAQAISDGASTEYANGIATYLAFGVSRLSDACNANCTWSPSADQSIHLFTKQAIPVAWDFSEANVFGGNAGDYEVSLASLLKVLNATPAVAIGSATQLDATTITGQGCSAQTSLLRQH